MKRNIFILLMVLILPLTVNAATQFQSGPTGSCITVDTSGNLDVSGKLAVTGTASAPGITFAPTTDATDPLIIKDSGGTRRGRLNVKEVWVDPDATSTSIITGAYAAGTNTASYKTTAAVLTITNDESQGRNIVVTISSGVTAGATLAGYVTITGTTTTGIAVTEVLVTSQTVSSNYAYVRLVSISVTITACDQVTARAPTGGQKASFAVGIGNKFGLSNSIYVVGDIYAVRENGVMIDPTAVTSRDATYDTIDFATNPTGVQDYEIWYRGVQDQY